MQHSKHTWHDEHTRHNNPLDEVGPQARDRARGPTQGARRPSPLCYGRNADPLDMGDPNKQHSAQVGGMVGRVLEAP